MLQNVTKKRKTSMTGLTFGSPSQCSKKNIAEGKTIGSKHAHIKYVYILFCSIVFIFLARVHGHFRSCGRALWPHFLERPEYAQICIFERKTVKKKIKILEGAHFRERGGMAQ